MLRFVIIFLIAFHHQCVLSTNSITCNPGSYFSESASSCLFCPTGTYSSSGKVCMPCAKGLNSFMGSSECTTSYALNAIGVNTIPDIQGGFDNSAAVKALNLTDTSFTTLTDLMEPARCFAMSVTGRFAVFGGLSVVHVLDVSTRKNTLIAGKIQETGFADGYDGADARFNSLGGMYLSRDETFVLVSDTNNNRIRKVFLNGTVLTLAGNGAVFSEECSGADALISGPTGITVSKNESIVVFVEKSARRIRRMDITANGVRVSPLAGNATEPPRILNGYGTSANFHTITDVTFTPDDRFVLVSESDVVPKLYPSVIRKVEVSTQNVSNFYYHRTYSMLYISFAYTDGTFLWVNAGTTTFGVTYPGAVYGMVQSSFNEQMRLAKAECKIPGYTLNGVENGFSIDTCSQCPAGKYSLGTGLFTAKCLPCPANSYSLAGASQCTANVGYYMVMARRTVDPYVGSFLVYNNNLSTAVPALPTSSSAAGVSVYVPTQVFSGCPRTTNCSNTSFLHCSSFGPQVCCGKQTYFLEGVLHSSDCQQCPLGEVSSGAGSSCRACAVGQYIAFTTCTDCAQGSYSTNNYQSACTLCPAGTYSSVVRAASPSVCVPCPAGTYQPNAGAASRQTCEQCTTGKYQSNQGETLGCSMCAEGTYQPLNSSATCIRCENPNAWSLQGATACECKAGYTKVNCAACAAGSFKAETGGGVCAVCPPNTFCPQAATSPMPCPAPLVSSPGSANTSDCVCEQGFAGPDCDPVLNVALVAGVVCGALVVVGMVVGVGLWCRKGGGVLVKKNGAGSQYEFNLLQNLNIDLRIDTRGHVPMERIQKD